MKKLLSIFSVIIGVVIFFYPNMSNSNTSGSVGGKTGSPTDGASCTACHYAAVGNGATITSNIPTNGYVPNQTYTITANINQTQSNKFGFEITAEEANAGSAKTGTFIITNSTETKLVNNNTSTTHKAAGTSGSNSKSWSVDWQAPSAGTGSVNFFAAFMAANGDGSPNGDTYHSTSINVNEQVITSAINKSTDKKIEFNTESKIITAHEPFSIYNIEGKLILESNKETANLSNLLRGIYIVKSRNNHSKIIIK